MGCMPYKSAGLAVDSRSLNTDLQELRWGSAIILFGLKNRLTIEPS